MEIEIKVRKNWDETELAKRIARIVSYSDAFCQKKESGYKWSLNYQGNDWWMSGIEEVEGRLGFDSHRHAIVKVSYRYGHGHEKMMEALKVFLQWEVGVHED